MTLETSPNFSMDLSGQAALVTGASSGLGMRFAKVLAAAGADVVACGRRADRLDSLAAEARGAPGKITALTVELSDADQVSALVARASEAAGLISILVNCAGIPDAQFATRMPLELIDKVIAINLRAPFILSAEMARRLIAAKRPGRIVNISSMSAFDYAGGAASLYSATKAGLNRMTEALAMEWAPYNINVNAIAPGAFFSDMMDAMLTRTGDISARFPRKRIGDPAQLDGALLYLVSPSSDFVTGTCIKVDDAQYHR